MSLKPHLRTVSWGLAGLAFGMGCWNTFSHQRDREFLRALALKVVAESNATDGRTKVLALRDYLRANVTWRGVPQEGRPFLRDSAVETIKSGRGWCGEGSRAFVGLARELGIPAQRIIFTGETPHVVAEAEVSPGVRLIVDSQEPPMVADLEPLDAVILRPQFEDYYSVNLERLGVRWLVNRVRLTPGAITYFLESPHAIKAASWFCLFAALLGALLVVPLMDRIRHRSREPNRLR